MLEIFDQNLRKQAVLENAFDRKEKKKLNGVHELSFSLPEDDAKNAFCAPFVFVRHDDGQYYRILVDGISRKDTGRVDYVAEHAIATLVDDIMFGTHMLGGEGMYTRQVISYIIGKQTKKRWKLGDCAFRKQFEYGFESENLLNALFSVPNLFVEKYMWVYDMETTPWTVHLRAIDEKMRPNFVIRAGKNLISSSAKRTGTEICTRLYLLGYGEGDNQLTISDINGGKPYLDAPREYIERYGLISKLYVDRQFEDAASLMERGRVVLAAMQEPQYARSFRVADLYEITNNSLDRATLGDVVLMEMDGTRAYITGTSRNLDKAGDMTVEMSTSAQDLAGDIADMADRQRIEQVYSQGATQIYAQSIQANADSKTAAQLNFFIPAEMRIINRVVAKISMESFRTYSRATRGGGGSTSTSSGGGGGSSTSSGGGGGATTSAASGAFSTTSGPSSVTTTTQFGGSTNGPEPSSVSYSQATISGSGGSGNTGGKAATTSNASSGSTGVGTGSGAHTHTISHTHTVASHTHSVPAHSHSVPSHTHSNYHVHNLAHSHGIAHTHTVSAGNHTHSVDLPSHTHSVSISAHTHGVTIPDHAHEIEHGIFRTGNPQIADILINGNVRAHMERDIEIDLTSHLLNASGKIPRGSFIRLGVLPNDLAYITIDIYVQGFVQSRGGGSY